MRKGSYPIRALTYYAIAVVGSAIYGGQVCPILAEFSAWKLGLVILIPLILAYGLRGPFEVRMVKPASLHLQPRMQFRMEFGLISLAGLASTLTLMFVYHFPLLHSGLKLLLGILTVGLYAALDLALARERTVIEASRSGRASYETPRKFSPITRTFFLATSLVLLFTTGIMMLVLVRDVHWLASQNVSSETIAFMNRSVLVEIGIIMGFLLIMLVNLILSYARNMRQLFRNQTEVLENVSRGDLTRQVPVITNNELGVIAGHTNTMIRSLREGVRMREGLLIASEVQQHFLPDHAPDLPGLDMAGTARFSDETGGDFFDFIECEQPDCTHYGVLVGDVSGHGIGAALLMAAGRALVRQSASLPAPLSQRLGVANRNLTRDVGETGRFMTLFFLEMAPEQGVGTWVNAGHQPPLFYDPATDEFSELKGKDIPLGVEKDWMFHEYTQNLPTSGQILIMGTDGAWEAMDPQGEMFGGERLRETLRKSAGKNAQDIILDVVEAVHNFTGRTTQEDDLTLVIIKGTNR